MTKKAKVFLELSFEYEDTFSGTPDWVLMDLENEIGCCCNCYDIEKFELVQYGDETDRNGINGATAINEYVRRYAAIDSITAEALERNLDSVMDDNAHRYSRAAQRVLAGIPVADVRPVIHGKWILNSDGSGTCSECMHVQKNCWDLDNWDNFCHHCGADMRVKI